MSTSAYNSQHKTLISLLNYGELQRRQFQDLFKGHRTPDLAAVKENEMVDVATKARSNRTDTSLAWEDLNVCLM